MPPVTTAPESAALATLPMSPCHTMSADPLGMNRVPIIAELMGSDMCEALGITGRTVLSLCRLLVATGHDLAQTAARLSRGEVVPDGPQHRRGGRVGGQREHPLGN